MFLWRPILSEPPLCSWRDVQTTYGLMDLARFHEAIDLKEEAMRRAMKEAEKHATRPAPK